MDALVLRSAHPHGRWHNSYVAFEVDDVDGPYEEGGSESIPAVAPSDRARLNQILVNLISNAVKYTQSGGRVVVSGRHDADGSPQGPGPCVALAVTDNGPGIAPDRQTLLFREFTRLDPAAAEGSGIGLAISQSIARALGAAITVSTTRGVGSTFMVSVPAMAAQVPAACQALIRAAPTGVEPTVGREKRPLV